MKMFKLALVGATGVVGREARKVLEEMNLPISKYVFLASSRSAGEKIEFIGSEYEIQELKEDSFDEGFDFAVFCAGGETSKKFSPIASSKGAIVVDNSSAFRMDENVPLVVPEVNPQDIAKNKGIIANPNCSTIQAVVPLKVLDDKYKIKRIIYSTYQAVSGAGKSGIEDLENGVNEYFDGEKRELKKFAHEIFNNCLPEIDVAMPNGYTKEEEKMINETRKILGKPELPVTATCVRVPVFNSHSESINVEFENEFDLNELIDTLKNSNGIIVENDLENHEYPLSTNATGHNEVYVGRIRRDFSIPNGLNFWCVADNIRKGAATNALQIVKYMIENN